MGKGEKGIKKKREREKEREGTLGSKTLGAKNFWQTTKISAEVLREALGLVAGRRVKRRRRKGKESWGKKVTLDILEQLLHHIHQSIVILRPKDLGRECTPLDKKLSSQLQGVKHQLRLKEKKRKEMSKGMSKGEIEIEIEIETGEKRRVYLSESIVCPILTDVRGTIVKNDISFPGLHVFSEEKEEKGRVRQRKGEMINEYIPEFITARICGNIFSHGDTVANGFDGHKINTQNQRRNRHVFTTDLKKKKNS